jgi:N-hydroxyarylamine O-acetyltransferase
VTDVEQETPHGIYRFRAQAAGYELDMRLPDTWATMYRFSREAQSQRDYEVFNWYTATHPSSRFVNNLVAARLVGDSRVNLFNDELTLQKSGGPREHRILAGAIDAYEVLTREFGIRIGRSEIERIWPRLPKLAQTGS